MWLGRLKFSFNLVGFWIGWSKFIEFFNILIKLNMCVIFLRVVLFLKVIIYIKIFEVKKVIKG